MNLKIDASNLLVRHYLTISDTGIEFCETAALGSPRKFRFEEVEAVLRGEGKLSFQAGGVTYKIAVDDSNGMHRAAAARLVSEARRTIRQED
jgi:hypothetical protein